MPERGVKQGREQATAIRWRNEGARVQGQAPRPQGALFSKTSESAEAVGNINGEARQDEQEVERGNDEERDFENRPDLRRPLIDWIKGSPHQ